MTEKKHTVKYVEGIGDTKDWLVVMKEKVGVVWLIHVVEAPVIGSFTTVVEITRLWQRS